MIKIIIIFYYFKLPLQLDFYAKVCVLAEK